MKQKFFELLLYSDFEYKLKLAIFFGLCILQVKFMLEALLTKKTGDIELWISLLISSILLLIILILLNWPYWECIALIINHSFMIVYLFHKKS